MHSQQAPTVAQLPPPARSYRPAPPSLTSSARPTPHLPVPAIPRSSSASPLSPLPPPPSPAQPSMPSIRINSKAPLLSSSASSSLPSPPRTSHTRPSSRLSPSHILIGLLVLLCLGVLYKAGDALLTSPSPPPPSAAPLSFLSKFPPSPSLLSPESLSLHKASLANPALSVDGAEGASTPQLLLLTTAHSTHPAPNSLPLLAERRPAFLPYQPLEPLPPPFPLSPPSSHHNEERSEAQAAQRTRAPTPASFATLTSPTSHKRVGLHISDDGQLGLSVSAGESPLLLPSYLDMAVNYRPCRWAKREGGQVEVVWQLSRGSSYWRPVPGAERRWYYAEYNKAEVWCEGDGCRHCPIRVEVRVYEEGVAVRSFAQPTADDAKALAADSQLEAEERLYAVVESSLQVALPPDFYLQCWANSQEEPYVKHECAAMLEPTMTPITVQLFNHPKVDSSPSYRLEQRFISLLQADGPSFMRSMGRVSSQYQSLLELSSKGQAHVAPLEGALGSLYLDGVGVVTPTAWHVVLIGNSPGELLEHNYLVPLLCAPPSPFLPNMVDTRWVGYGKSLRGRGFDSSTAQANTQQLMQWAGASHYQIVHFDAGWYGVETNKTETATRVYPDFHNLDMAVAGTHAKEAGVKFTVYVNDLALRETEQLIRLYRDWGVGGVKFGFVNTNSPRAMRVLHERIVAFASTHLFVNVHDLYRPKGLTRTWPHLVTQEGIRGEERKPSADHHTILPWVRLVQGSADYTPRYLKGSGLLCTRAHQLALPILLFSPIQSLFWAEPAQAIMDGVRWYYPELVVWAVLVTTWDDTRVLASEIGGYASVARRAGQEWFVGTITNTEATTLHLNLSTLFLPLPLRPRSLLPPPAKGYLVHIYADAYSAAVPTTLGGRNSIKVLPRMTYILPPQLSSELEGWGEAKADALPDYDEASVAHVRTMAEGRRAVWSEFDAQMREDKKHFLQKESDWEVMRTGVVAIDMAPSGGHVMYIQPWL